MGSKINIDLAAVERCRTAAGDIASEVVRFASQRTTDAVERATLRMLGVEGADSDGVHLVNKVVDSEGGRRVIGFGISLAFGHAMAKTGFGPSETARAIAEGRVVLEQPTGDDTVTARNIVTDLAKRAIGAIKASTKTRTDYIDRLGEGQRPLLYAIVATGNIYEDVVQAKVAAQAGAQIIAVIRSTAQSLLDYIPEGATTEGFGGTFATQENFRIMRKAMDEASEELGRYVRVCNYASGLCMPEVAALGAIERLDVMLNDALYGILFRDINMQRTLTDQMFARLISAVAGIIINTGEDNYLTTSDAYEAAHTVLASDFINEQIALLCGLRPEQLGLGHAMEIDPSAEDMLVNEIAMAQLVRECFPDSPIKYMPPTRYMTGNIFRGHVQDALFNLVSAMTNQGIHLLGMMTEAMHTPHIHDRYLSIESGRMIMNAARHLGDEICFKGGGIVEERSRKVLNDTESLLEDVQRDGLFASLERGVFAEVKRTADGGRGLAGVHMKTRDYFNPVEDGLWEEAGVGSPIRTEVAQ